MLIVMAVLGVVTIGAIIWAIVTHVRECQASMGSMISLISAGIIALIFGVICIVVPVGEQNNYREFQATRTTLAIYREQGATNELTAANIKAIEANQWLANAKYWKETLWLGFAIPDEVRAEEFIK